MTMTAGTFQHKFDAKLLRLVIVVIGLLVIEAFINHLPMVENINSAGQSTLPSVASVIGAIIDTLIFIAIIACTRDIAILLRSRASQIREIDKIIMLTAWTIVIAMGYRAYQGIIVPFLGHYAGLYDWFTFLLLLVPLTKLGFVVYRNLDPIVEMIANSMDRMPVTRKVPMTQNRSAATGTQSESSGSKRQRDRSIDGPTPGL